MSFAGSRSTQNSQQNTFNASAVEFSPANIELPDPSTIREFHPSPHHHSSNSGMATFSNKNEFTNVGGAPFESDSTNTGSNIDYSAAAEYAAARQNAAAAEMSGFGPSDYSTDRSMSSSQHPVVTMEFTNSYMVMDPMGSVQQQGGGGELGYGGMGHVSQHSVTTPNRSGLVGSTRPVSSEQSNVCKVRKTQAFSFA